MGIKNSPNIFQQKISELMLEGLEDFIRAAYFDDILIITKGSYVDHLKKVAEVQELEYLGYW
jgi:hypothetical protein